INGLYNIDGFEFVQRNRKNGKGGGVGIYLRNNLKWNRRQDLESEHVENIWIEINIPKSANILPGVYYRPPNTSKFFSKDFDNILNETLRSATDEQKEIILMGDLNVNYLSKSDNKNFKELLSLCGLTQLINVPTRVTQDSKSLIDIIATNNESSIVSTNVFPLSIGDHDDWLHQKDQ
ncbi:MAG: endonuclease/exonuclease/phosphatase family protein, partial [Pseudomonadota bacterium]